MLDFLSKTKREFLRDKYPFVKAYLDGGSVDDCLFLSDLESFLADPSFEETIRREGNFDDHDIRILNIFITPKQKKEQNLPAKRIHQKNHELDFLSREEITALKALAGVSSSKVNEGVVKKEQPDLHYRQSTYQDPRALELAHYQQFLNEKIQVFSSVVLPNFGKSLRSLSPIKHTARFLEEDKTCFIDNSGNYIEVRPRKGFPKFEYLAKGFDIIGRLKNTHHDLYITKQGEYILKQGSCVYYLNKDLDILASGHNIHKKRFWLIITPGNYQRRVLIKNLPDIFSIGIEELKRIARYVEPDGDHIITHNGDLIRNYDDYDIRFQTKGFDLVGPAYLKGCHYSYNTSDGNFITITGASTRYLDKNKKVLAEGHTLRKTRFGIIKE